MSNNPIQFNEYSIALRVHPLLSNLFTVYFSPELHPSPSGRYNLTRVFFLFVEIVDLLNSTSCPLQHSVYIERFRLHAFSSRALMNGILAVTSKVEHENRRSFALR
jgi:hypothetical protein